MIAGSIGQDLAQALGGAGGLRELAPDLADSCAERARGKHRIEHELRRACPPVMRPASTSCAPYQSTPTTLAKTRKMAIAGQHRARVGVDARAASKAPLDRVAEARRGRPLHA